MQTATDILRFVEGDSIFRRILDSMQVALRVLSVVVFFYFFDNSHITGMDSNVIFRSIILIYQFFICTVAKIIITAGGLGNIAKIAIGEEYLLTKECLGLQVKRYWKVVSCCACLPALLHFLLFFASGHNQSFAAIATACNIPLLIILGLSFYPSLANRKRTQHIKIDIQSVLVIGLIFIFTNFFSYAVRSYLRDHFIMSSLFNLGIKIIELVVFIFFIKSLHSQAAIERDGPDDPQLILINPPFSGTLQALSSLALWLYPPVFIVLKALTPKKYRIKEYNRILWRDQYYQGNALVAITCLTANSAEAYKIAKEFKKRGSKVVMGGPHVSVFPEEALDFCNSVVVGPAESVWQNVIQDYERGALKVIYSSTPLEADVARVRSYFSEQPAAVMADFLETKRGCKFKCYFCANPSLQKGLEVCSNSVEQMILYLRKLASRCNQISFIDTNIYADPEYMKELLRAMIPLKLRWVALASIDIVTDDEAMELLKESGCVCLLIGYEISAGSEEAGRGGKLALANRYVNLTRKLKQADIKIKGHFIYGFESDGFTSLLRLWFFCFKLWPHVTVLSFLTPIPGSAFFANMVRDNRLRDVNWRSYNLHTLVYDNPSLDNFIFRKAFSLVMLIFLGTTSTVGMFIISSCGILFYIAFRCLNLS